MKAAIYFRTFSRQSEVWLSETRCLLREPVSRDWPLVCLELLARCPEVEDRQGMAGLVALKTLKWAASLSVSLCFRAEETERSSGRRPLRPGTLAGLADRSPESTEERRAPCNAASTTQKTGYRFNSFEILMLNVTLSDMQNKSVLSLALATVYRPPGPYTDFLKELEDFLSDLLVNVDKALIVGDFNIHVDNTNDVLGLAFTDLINSFGVKQNVTGPTHRFNQTLDLIISHGIDLTDIDIVPKSDDVTVHFLVSYMLHINDFNYMAPRYLPGRTIVPATKDRFTNNLPDLSQLFYVHITTDELDKITSNMGTIFSNTLETVAPIK